MGLIHQVLFDRFTIGDFSPVRIMGIVNLSPESFHPQSYISPAQLADSLTSMVQAHVDLIDFGGRSTAPWSQIITVEEEEARIQRALQQVSSCVPRDIPLSIDTQYAKVAQIGLQFGKEYGYHVMINDISSFHTDPALLDLCISEHCPMILMASKEKPGDCRTIPEVIAALHHVLQLVENKHGDMSQIIIDPGVGRWITEKTYEYDVAMLDQLGEFRCFMHPILVGLSRKSFIGSILDEKDPAKRTIGSAAATTIAAYNGAHIIRTHDFDAQIIQSVRIASAIRKKPFISHIDHQTCEILPDFAFASSANVYLLQHGVDEMAAQNKSKEIISITVILRNLTSPQIQTLKQQFLPIGGDILVESETPVTENQKNQTNFNIILRGTLHQFEKLIFTLEQHPSRFDTIRQLLHQTLTQHHDVKTNYAISFPKYPLR